MNEITVQTPSDLDSRMRRSKGRLARRCGANVKLTPDELAELEGVAKREGKALGEWGREQLVAAARRPKEDVLLTELVGLRMHIRVSVSAMVLGEVLLRMLCAVDCCHLLGAGSMRTSTVCRTIASTVPLAGWCGNGLLDAKGGGGISALMLL